MHIAIIGSGPVGMVAALLAARRGHRITLVDRDPGPVAGRPWRRLGVMQFELPHGFRPQCRDVLVERLPDVYEALLAAGAEPVAPAGAPAASAALAVRRSVLERVIWERTSAEPGISRLTGHVDRVEVAEAGGPRVVGLAVGSRLVAADLVVDASGRTGLADRTADVRRPPARQVDCPMAYAARQYRLLDPSDRGPTDGPVLASQHRGFTAMVFRHDAGTFTVLFIRARNDRALALLRHTDAFEAAVRMVPKIAAWTDPTRSAPIDVVRAGAGLVNAYRPQPTIAGLVAIGDAFCMTNPQGGRGMTLGMRSAAAFVDLLAADVPVEELRAGLDRWGEEHLAPWYADHVAWDAALLSSWAGRPIDPAGPIGVETLVAAADERHPEWWPALGRFFAMQVLPAALDPLRSGGPDHAPTGLAAGPAAGSRPRRARRRDRRADSGADAGVSGATGTRAESGPGDPGRVTGLRSGDRRRPASGRTAGSSGRGRLGACLISRCWIRSSGGCWGPAGEAAHGARHVPALAQRAAYRLQPVDQPRPGRRLRRDRPSSTRWAGCATGSWSGSSSRPGCGW